jgi:hypothetical protein
VIDLGRDVPPEAIVRAAKENKARLGSFRAYDYNRGGDGRDDQTLREEGLSECRFSWRERWSPRALRKA